MGRTAKTPFRWIAAVALCAVASTGIYLFGQLDISDSPPLPSQTSGRPEADANPPSGYTPDVAQGHASGATYPGVEVAPDSARAEVTPQLASAPTTEQKRIFDTLRARLHDKQLRVTHTYREFIAMSEADYLALPRDMQDRLMREMADLRERGEFGPDKFRAEPAVEPAQPAEPPPTPEQQLTYEDIRRKLYDARFTQSRTLGQLAALPELATLPPSLRAQLGREAMEMLSRGELRLLSESDRANP